MILTAKHRKQTLVAQAQIKLEEKRSRRELIERSRQELADQSRAVAVIQARLEERFRARLGGRLPGAELLVGPGCGIEMDQLQVVVPARELLALLEG